MIKVDLHIHTIAAPNERQFDFDLAALSQYTEDRSLDCIAITNHNLFDLEQFKTIREALTISVLAGIELDFEEGQLLLISDCEDLEKFEIACRKVSVRDTGRQNPLTCPELIDIFGDLSNFLLIPHYDKDPKVGLRTLEQLQPHVTCGEVCSPKKFVYCLNGEDRLVPIYASDWRAEQTENSFPLRYTYLDSDDPTLDELKRCLADKGCVSLTAEDGNDFFEALPNGQLLSTRLNVIIGGRSTGKSFTLDKIKEQFPEAKYIPQHSLVSSSEDEDQERFNKILSNRNSTFSKAHLEELERVVANVIDIDLEQNEYDVDEYLARLKKLAQEHNREDAFSKAKLFRESKFQILDNEGLEELIRSTEHLIENIDFANIIERHVSRIDLKTLIVDLMTTHGQRSYDSSKKRLVNELVQDIQRKLQQKSSGVVVPELNLYQVAMDQLSVHKFEEVVREARVERIAYRTTLQGFELVARVGEFRNATDLGKVQGKKGKFSNAFSTYSQPYQFLQSLKELDQLERADLYRYFVKVDFQILNRDGLAASGGERSEFNLLEEIKNAQTSEIVLIDEPESSFDNIFLKDSVNELIRDISKTTPVVLVTHNSTVGVSIKPNYILCTEKTIEDGEPVFRTFSGRPSSKALVCTDDGSTMSTWQATIISMEAGEPAYEERKKHYEDIKD